MTELRELHIEQAAIEWLQELGYAYKPGSQLSRNVSTVVLEEELREFLTGKYPQLPADILNDVVTQFVNNAGSDLDYRNRDFHLKLTKGIDVTLKDKNGNENALHVYPVDFDEPENNHFCCVNQLEIVGRNRRIPDLLVYINGLPLVVFEFRNWFDHNTTGDEAFNQIQHYKQDIPLLFEYNAITVISDGRSARHGMFPASLEWFTPWKSINGRDVVEDNDFQLNSLLKGLFPKNRLLNYIRYFIFFENHNGSLIKKGAKYHQYFGVNFAIEKTIKAIKPGGDGRIGVICHTQGSGKSISMAIYTGILRQLTELRNPTIVIQVDRNDLDWQLYDNFVLCKDIVGEFQRAKDTDDLRRLLDRNAGSVIFITIEKFRLKNVPVHSSPTADGFNSSPRGGARRAEGVNPSPTADGFNSSPRGGARRAEGVNPSPTAEGVNPSPIAEGVNPSPTADAVNSSPRGGARRAEGVNPRISSLLLPHLNTVDRSKFSKMGILLYNPALKARAHENRYAHNLPEVLLWNQLKRDALGVDFHRQKPIGNFIVDLFCPELMLAIEVDGASHDIESIALNDKKRQTDLEALGIIVLRFTTDQIKNQIHRVVSAIEEYVISNKLEVKLSPYERGIVNKNPKIKEAIAVAAKKESIESGEPGETTPPGLRPPAFRGETENELLHSLLSARENIIVIADEAHRTQYGLLDSFAANLRVALPNASFIGLTGTPVDNNDAGTEALFGEVIHTSQ